MHTNVWGLSSAANCRTPIRKCINIPGFKICKRKNLGLPFLPPTIRTKSYITIMNQLHHKVNLELLSQKVGLHKDTSQKKINKETLSSKQLISGSVYPKFVLSKISQILER